MPANSVRAGLALLALGAVLITCGTGSALASHRERPPDFGPNVKIFDPAMPASQIKATVEAIAARQVSDQFGGGRYALLFKPGSYGTPAAPLNVQVGYYTDVAGLGASPRDVTVNGTIDVYNQCVGPGDCTA